MESTDNSPQSRQRGNVINMKIASLAVPALAVVLAVAGCGAIDAEPASSPEATTSAAPVTTVTYGPEAETKSQCRLLIAREIGVLTPDWGDDPVRLSSERVHSWDSTVHADDGRSWRFGCIYYPQSNKLLLLYLDEE